MKKLKFTARILHDFIAVVQHFSSTDSALHQLFIPEISELP